MRTLIYTWTLVLLGMHVLELNAGLAPTWHYLAQIALAIGMWSVLVAWFRIERDSAEPAREQRQELIQRRTKNWR